MRGGEAGTEPAGDAPHAGGAGDDRGGAVAAAPAAAYIGRAAAAGAGGARASLASAYHYGDSGTAAAPEAAPSGWSATTAACALRGAAVETDDLDGVGLTLCRVLRFDAGAPAPARATAPWAGDMGAVFIVQPHAVQRLCHAAASADPRVGVRHAARAAYQASGGAIIMMAGAGAQPGVVFNDAEPDGAQAAALYQLLRAVGAESIGDAAKTHPALPALQRELARLEACVTAHALTAQGRPHSPASRQTRAARLALDFAAQRELAAGGDPADVGARLASWTNAILSRSAEEPLPPAYDFARLAPAAGWRQPAGDGAALAARLPPRPRDARPGFVQPMELALAVQRLADARRYPVKEGDPILAVVQSTYSHDLSLGPDGVALLQHLTSAAPQPQLQPHGDADERRNMGTVVAALAERGVAGTGPLRLGKAPAPGPDADTAFNGSASWAARGVFTHDVPDTVPLIVSPATVVEKGTTLSDTPAMRAAAAAGGEHAAAYADAAAAKVIAAAEAAVATGAGAEEALEAATAGACEPPASRFVVNLSALSSLMLPSAFRYPTMRAMLGTPSPARRVFKLDARAFFYTIVLSQLAARLCCYCLYAAALGRSILVLPLRLLMGSRGSPAIATAAGAVCAYAALIEFHERYGAAPMGPPCGRLDPVPSLTPGAVSLECYVDDLIGAGEGAEADVLYGVLRDVLGAARIELAAGAGKISPPSGTIESALGRRVSFPTMTIELNPTKALLYNTSVAITDAALRSNTLRAGVTAAHVRALVGALGWWAEVQPQGRAHLGALYAAGNGTRPLAVLRGQMLVNLAFWLEACRSGTLHSAKLMGDGAGSRPAAIASDAGDTGLAAETRAPDGRWRAVWRLLTDEERLLPSVERELRALAAGVWLALEALPAGAAARIVAHTDNHGAMLAINRHRMRTPHAASDAIISGIHAAVTNADSFLLAINVPREADAISVCDMLADLPSLADARRLYVALRGPTASVAPAGGPCTPGDGRGAGQ